MSDFMEMLETLKKGGVDNPDDVPHMQGGGYLSPPRLFMALRDQPTFFPGVAKSVTYLTTQAYRATDRLREDQIAKGNERAWGLLRNQIPNPGGTFPCTPMDWPDLMSLRIAFDCDFNGVDRAQLTSRSATRSAMAVMNIEGQDGMGFHWPDRHDLDETWWPPRVWAEAVALCHLVKLLQECAK